MSYDVYDSEAGSSPPWWIVRGHEVWAREYWARLTAIPLKRAALRRYGRG